MKERKETEKKKLRRRNSKLIHCWAQFDNANKTMISTLVKPKITKAYQKQPKSKGWLFSCCCPVETVW